MQETEKEKEISPFFGLILITIAVCFVATFVWYVMVILPAMQPAAVTKIEEPHSVSAAEIVAKVESSGGDINPGVLAISHDPSAVITQSPGNPEPYGSEAWWNYEINARNK